MSFVEKPAEQSVNDGSIDWSANFMLVSSDDSTVGFVVSKKAERMSPFLQPLLADGSERVIVPVKNLAHSTIQNCAWYLAHFAENEEKPRATDLDRPFVDDEFSECHLTAFEFHFAKTLYPKVGERNLKVLTGLLAGAQFLQLQPLIDMTACAVTFHLRDKTPDEMKELMHDQVPEYTKDPPADEDAPAKEE